MIKALVFDFDGVLVESVDIKTNAFAKLFEEEGDAVVKKVVAYHLQNTGVSRFDKVRYIYANILKRELSEKRFKELCDRFSKLVMDEVVRAPYVKGGKDFLEAYHGEYKCFVASATPYQEMEDIIDRRGMRGYFVKVFGAPKKKTDAVKDVIVGYGLSSDEVAYVGDAMSDYEAARINHIHFIARTRDNEPIFNDIKCIKVCDMVGLKNILDGIGKQ